MLVYNGECGGLRSIKQKNGKFSIDDEKIIQFGSSSKFTAFYHCSKQNLFLAWGKELVGGYIDSGGVLHKVASLDADLGYSAF